MSVCCECCVLSGRRLCDGLIPRLEESYRVWCRNFDIKEAYAHWGLFNHDKKNLYTVPLTRKTFPKTGTKPKIQLSPSPLQRKYFDINMFELSYKMHLRRHFHPHILFIVRIILRSYWSPGQ